MGHGSGGRMSHDLIKKIFLPRFANTALSVGDDAGVISLPGGERLAVSTDSHVVWPLFFPGGDIGRLAVCGTVNDVAVMGARPLYLTAGFILEEGLDFSILKSIVESMQKAAMEAGVEIISGDTKVVQKGKADGIYINTAGVGLIPGDVDISGRNAKSGDRVILSGPIGDHGIAVLVARGELGFFSDITSDVAPLNHMVSSILERTRNVHVFRDPTRGGLATTLNEIAQQSQVGIVIHEPTIPVNPSTAAACEILGFDPLYVANEGKLICIVAPQDAKTVLDVMHESPYGEQAVVIGEVVENPKNRVLEKTSFGSTRVVDVLAGEMLPRIC